MRNSANFVNRPNNISASDLDETTQLFCDAQADYLLAIIMALYPQASLKTLGMVIILIISLSIVGIYADYVPFYRFTLRSSVWSEAVPYNIL